MFYRLRSGASVFLLTLVALLTFGCGDSHEFVATGTGGGGPGLVNGSELVFRFERPVAAQTEVPVTTASVRFDLFSSPTPSTGALISTETRLYADLIVLTDVPTETRSVRVVLLDADGVPIGFYTATVSVPANSRVEVTLSQADFSPAVVSALALTPDPLEFFVTLSDKSTSRTQLTATATIDGAPYQIPVEKVSLTPEHSTVLEILEAGWVSVRSNFMYFLGAFDFDSPEFRELHPNTSSVTATYTLNEVTKQATVPVIIHRFYSILGVVSHQIELVGLEGVPTPPGASIPFYSTPLMNYVDDFDDDDEYPSAIYQGPDNELVELFAEDLTYRLDSPSDKITFDPATGILAVADDAPLGTVFHMELTWVDDRPGGSAHTYVDRATFIVDEGGFSLDVK